jgi:hypothetical protein
MKIKRVIFQITNKAKQKDHPSYFSNECIMKGLPAIGKSETFECIAKIYNDTKLTKGVIRSILESGETYIDDFFYLDFDYRLTSSSIDFVKEKGCFKYNIVSILDNEN